MSETLTGRTTRVISFIDKAAKTVTFADRKPAGTLVYVTALTARPGLFRVRVPGTLLEQDVYLNAVEPA